MADDRKIIEFVSSSDGGDPDASAAQNEILRKEMEEILSGFERYFESQDNLLKKHFESQLPTADDLTPEQSSEDNVPPTQTGGDSGDGEPPEGNDPFSTSGFSDDIQRWLDDLEEEYRQQNEILERSNAAFDELTEQADALGEEEEVLIGTTGRLSAVVLAAAAAAYLFHEALEDMIEAVGPFSAALNQATAEARVQRMEDQARAAEQIGDDAADMQVLQNELAREWRDIWREGLDIIAPFLKFIGEAMVLLVTSLRVIVQGVNTIASFLETIWDSIPDFAKNFLNPISAVHKLLEKIKGNSDRSRNKTTNEQMDKLFGPGDIPFDIEAIKRGVESGRPVTPPTNASSSSASSSSLPSAGDGYYPVM